MVPHNRNADEAEGGRAHGNGAGDIKGELLFADGHRIDSLEIDQDRIALRWDLAHKVPHARGECRYRWEVPKELRVSEWVCHKQVPSFCQVPEEKGYAPSTLRLPCTHCGA